MPPVLCHTPAIWIQQTMRRLTFHKTPVCLYSMSFTFTCFLLLQLTIVSAQVCRLGTIRLQNGTCQQCTPGTYYNDFHGPAQCTACDAGTFLRVSGAEIFSACRGCPPGTFSGQGASQCAPCPNGTSSSRRSSRCVQCPPGTRLPDNGQGEEDCVPFV